MSFVKDFIMKRNTSRTNCFLFETLDYKRLEEFKRFLAKDYHGLIHADEPPVIIEHDLQRGTLMQLTLSEDGFNYRRVEQTPQDMQGGMFGLHNRLLSTKFTVILFKWVILEQTHAKPLEDALIAWSNDDDLYKYRSTAIVFTSSAGLFNETIRSRMCYTISIPTSSAEERKVAIDSHKTELESQLTLKGVKVEIKVDPNLVNATSGLTLHDIETGCYESFFETFKEAPQFLTSVFTKYKRDILGGYGIEYVEPRSGFETVGGYDYLKNYVQKRIIRLLMNPELAHKYGHEPPRGLVLFGPPGTGKTLFANALSKEIGLPMLKLSSADFLRGIVGESEQRVRQLVQLLESLAPCVVFVDEVDQLALSREGMYVGDSGVRINVQNMILDWLGQKERRTFLVGATNFIDKMDKAFLRPGRIDEVVMVLPPDRKARVEILKVHTQVVRKVPILDVDFDRVADATPMWSGAELEKLVKEASGIAMDTEAKGVTMGHFLMALKSFEVDTSSRLEQVMTMVKKVKEFESVNQIFLNEALAEFTKTEDKDNRLGSVLKGL